MSLLAILCLSGLYAQNHFSSEYWEENWRDWPRPRFDNRVDSFAAVENIVLREYFNSNSKISGEVYRHYACFQYPDFESIKNNAQMVFQLPNYVRLDDIDFRIWEDDFLVYEARAAALREYYLDTLGADPITKKMFAFGLRFPDLKPGAIVEVMISCLGVPLPYRLSFEQTFPVIRSSQRIKILSAYPLRYQADSTIVCEKERLWDYDLYKFAKEEVSAYPIETSLSTKAKDLPGVWIDWKDQIFYYDRDERDDWEDLLPYLFYEGDLRDFVVYRNSLAEDFGKQQFYSSWIRPVRFFHRRAENLAANSSYAEGRWRLSKAYAKIWIEVEDQLNRIVLENEVQDFEEALNLVLMAQKRAVKRYLKELPLEPPVFTEYGLLCSHLEKLFKYFRYDHRLGLFGPERFGKPSLAFASPWSASARGMLFRKDSNQAWQYIIPGPYMSQFYGPNQLPPDLDHGWVQAFERNDTVPEVLALPSADYSKHGFRHVFSIQEPASFDSWVIRDSLHLKGAFRSILASAYLRSDSVKDHLSYTNHQLHYQIEKNEDLILEKTKSIAKEDTFRMEVPLHEASILQSMPTPARSFALPMPFRAQWNYRFESQDSLQIDLPLPWKIDNEVFGLSWQWERKENSWLLTLRLDLKKALISADETAYFLAWQEFVKRPLALKVWKN